ncbi:hypothetical protein [Thalassolituus oleivorans]|uniref:capsular polysaccharide export protein, LipB/KpsS family n=1 Tax=Thalassolituus oleivorans TaxID=187493 RepID=UPI0023F2B5FF|nr:hypothetical protein [Thalassolituus oleivorans]
MLKILKYLVMYFELKWDDMSVIVLCVDSVERYWFFLRIYRALKNDYKIIILTTEPMVKLLAVLAGLRSKLITEHVVECVGEDEYIGNSIEIINGQFSYEQGRVYFRSIVSALKKLNGCQKIVVWNGQHLFGRAVQYCEMNFECHSQYLELANFSGRIFSDPMGVNANSSIAKFPDILDGYDDVTEEFHEQWLGEYRLSKLQPIPQSKQSNLKRALSVSNMLMKRFYPSVNRLSLNSLASKRVHVSAPDIQSSSIPDQYIFLPLQVSGDTQIRLHSSVDNLDAIDIAASMAADAGLSLVVKIHPAEYSELHIADVVEKIKSCGAVISALNTTDLIQGSVLVVTINSTVGLEAMILGKSVKVLGRALYNDFDQHRLRKYLHGYLVSGVDYFSDEPISFSVAKRVVGL